MKIIIAMLLILCSFGCNVPKDNDRLQELFAAQDSLIATYNLLVAAKDSTIMVLEENIKAHEDFAVKSFTHGYLKGQLDILKGRYELRGYRIAEFRKEFLQ